MSIATELQDLEGFISDSYDMVEAKNGVIPQNKNMQNLPNAIASIQAGQIIIPPSAGSLVSISVTQQPTKTTYLVGEYFNPQGCVVIATYTNQNIDVTASCSFIVNTPLNGTETQVTVNYEGQTASIPITVTFPPIPAPNTTTQLYHFNNSLKNEVTNNNATVWNGTASYNIGKFQQGVTAYLDLEYMGLTNTDLMNNSYTFECWAKLPSNASFGNIFRRMVNASSFGKIFSGDYFSTLTTNGLKMNTTGGAGENRFAQNCTIDTIPSTFDFTQFHHYAVVINAGHYKTFLDGVLACHGDIFNDTTANIYNIRLNPDVVGCIHDEFLVCNSAKYVSNFTPPTGPYYLT